MAKTRRYRPTARRKMIWARSMDLLGAAAIGAAGTAVDLLAQFRADGGSSLGSTVTRVRIDISLVWAVGDGISPADQLAYGVIVDQLQTDQVEVPRPGEEPHADWMHWRRVGAAEGPSLLPIVAGTGVASSWLTTMTIDVQSQRKMEELGQTLWLVVDPTFTGSTSLNMSANSSVLLKLP